MQTGKTEIENYIPTKYVHVTTANINIYSKEHLLIYILSCIDFYSNQLEKYGTPTITPWIM